MQTSKIIVRLVRTLAVAGFMACSAFFVTPSDASTAKRFSAKSIQFVENQEYKAECGSCHIAFLPGFLPARSWSKLMDGLEDHFGEDASLDGEESKVIRKFLEANAADAKKSSVRSKKIAKLIAQDESPIRITETPFWSRKHSSIKRYVWKRDSVKSKASCDSCHKDAAKGLYSEYDVHIPK